MLNKAVRDLEYAKYHGDLQSFVVVHPTSSPIELNKILTCVLDPYSAIQIV